MIKRKNIFIFTAVGQFLGRSKRREGIIRISSLLFTPDED